MSGNLSLHHPIFAGGLATTVAGTAASLSVVKVETGFPAQRTVRSVTATLQGSAAPGVRASHITSVIGTDGTITFYLWEATSASDTTLIAATTSVRAFYWLAICD